jgi:hypothetical protein
MKTKVQLFIYLIMLIIGCKHEQKKSSLPDKNIIEIEPKQYYLNNAYEIFQEDSLFKKYFKSSSSEMKIFHVRISSEHNKTIILVLVKLLKSKIEDVHLFKINWFRTIKEKKGTYNYFREISSGIKPYYIFYNLPQNIKLNETESTNLLKFFNEDIYKIKNDSILMTFPYDYWKIKGYQNNKLIVNLDTKMPWIDNDYFYKIQYILDVCKVKEHSLKKIDPDSSEVYRFKRKPAVLAE